jgi:hypothetical protein
LAFVFFILYKRWKLRPSSRADACSSHETKTARFEYAVAPTEEPGLKSRHAVGHNQRGRERARKHRAMKRAIFGAEESAGQATHLLTLDRTVLTPGMSRVEMPPANHELVRAAQGHRRADVGPRLGCERQSCGVCDGVPGPNLRRDLDADVMCFGIATQVADQDAPGLDAPRLTRTLVDLRQHVVGHHDVDVGDVGLTTIV